MVPAMASAQTSGETFSGPYIGVQGGWNQGQDEDVLTGPGRTGAKKSGVVVRGVAGYGHAIGEHVVIGAEAGIATGGRDISTVNGTSQYITNPGITLDAVARLGVKPIDNVMLFGKAGWAFQRIETTLITPSQRLTDKSSEHGFLFGGGVEVGVTPNVALRAEFDRVSFNDNYARNRALAGVSLRF
ncbi:outer membrane protein [Croceibacterium xixiisoli]|nr:outer membrane beta-barrel protein [Croceibacterium xixiisoli]